MKNKRILFKMAMVVFALCVVNVLDYIVVEAATYGDYTYTLINNDTEVEITGYAGSATEITIPDVIGGKEVTSIGYEAFRDCSSLISVAIPGSVTSIEAAAFSDCSSLTDITIPSSVTSIGPSAFDQTKWLENKRQENPLVIVNGILIDARTVSGEVVIPNSVTIIGGYAFFDCSSLTSITIPSSVTSIGAWAFGYCSSLTSIIIPSSVKSIEAFAFSDCSSLTSITIPSSVTSIGKDVLSECENIIVYANEGSVAEEYAKNAGYTVLPIPENTTGESDEDNGNAGGGNNGNTSGGETPGENTAPIDTTKPVPVTSITITGSSKKIAAGKKIILSVEIAPADATEQTVTWTSSNPKYATVSANGVVTTSKKGAGKSVTITASTKDGKSAVYELKLLKNSVKSIKLKAKSKSVKAGKKITVKAEVKTTGKDSNKALIWSCDKTDYATVSKKGVVTTQKAGKGKTIKITATATDGSGKKATIKIKIK